MEQAYAQALWNMIDRGMTPMKAVHALRDVLKTRGREVLFPRIAKAFERIAMRQRQKSGITLYVANEKEARRAKDAAQAALAQMKIGIPNRFDMRIDETLIGGWRLEGSGVMVDRSYKKHLLTLFNRTTVE